MKLLEIASNVAIILAAGAVGVTVIYDRVVSPERFGEAPANTFAKQYEGKRLPLPGFQPGVTTTTVVLFVSKSCHVCAESVPFYRQIAAMRSTSSDRIRIVAAVPQAIETEAEARTYFSDRGILLDQAIPVPFRAIGLMATPTVALVGSDSIVRDVWVGKLTPDKEAEALGRIEAVCCGLITNSSGARQ